jgi:hypothetical protein
MPKKFNQTLLHHSVRERKHLFEKKINKEMLNVENLLKPMTIKALINIVHNYFI